MVKGAQKLFGERKARSHSDGNIMSVLHLTLLGGDRISIKAADISIICEVKPPKASKSPIKTNIRISADDKGWDVQEPYDVVIAAWAVALELEDDEEPEAAND